MREKERVFWIAVSVFFAALWIFLLVGWRIQVVINCLYLQANFSPVLGDFVDSPAIFLKSQLNATCFTQRLCRMINTDFKYCTLYQWMFSNSLKLTAVCSLTSYMLCQNFWHGWPVQLKTQNLFFLSSSLSIFVCPGVWVLYCCTTIDCPLVVFLPVSSSVSVVCLVVSLTVCLIVCLLICVFWKLVVGFIGKWWGHVFVLASSSPVVSSTCTVDHCIAIVNIRMIKKHWTMFTINTFRLVLCCTFHWQSVLPQRLCILNISPILGSFHFLPMTSISVVLFRGDWYLGWNLVDLV